MSTDVLEFRARIPVLNHPGADSSGKALPRGARRGERCVLVLGQDQITGKAVYYAKELEKHGVRSYFLSADKSGLSRENLARFGIAGEIVPRGLFRHWARAWRLLRELEPSHVELFPGVAPWTLVVYVLAARARRVPILTWCRGGGIRDWSRHHWIRRLVNRFAYRASRRILLREHPMADVFLEHAIADPSKLRFCHNAIPLPPPPPPQGEREPLVLFLNSLRRMRHPELVIDAARIVFGELPTARFELVGATANFAEYSPAPGEFEAELAERIRAQGVGDRVALLPFTNEPESYLRRAKVFVLPADVVFCNFSLLEAMAMEVVPIVAKVEGSELIVEDGLSGFIVERDAQAIADKVLLLLRDDELRRRMGRAARETVARRYNCAETVRGLLRLYREELWER